ncbi:iron uptake system protein EfeO [Domibacillus sp. DTU_2020_1001157_1_SI_ALB_TIR_016]|uniref:iron uptake system protein EfeO n=1 Tax=Domibacillus sp. DTU_2020_1001157_1_SI_ALB_TIR_016 TaxID=3077789 RepID=UPI0028E976E6|nr:iron uptake system protein EfeO [Domibacillus sp. DTU_2020_1001157_1_SI_ALB_TIR_016]WNS82289.1 iron uptake system protein EfeO [Domibacillus sp. DTU_2020_1001157_1_SI_ALB_TIR_016]
MKKWIKTTTILAAAASLAACSQEKAAEPAETEKTPDLSNVTEEYRAYAISEIDAFVTETEGFAEAVKSGDIEEAKAAYAPARMHYERAEPIAEVFGDLDPKIDAREGDVPEAEWTGYHRIEKGLWVDGTTEGYEQYAQQLIDDTKLLRAKVETVEVTPDLLITGAVDLLNEVSTSKVTGEEDRYSHTDLYDFAANVEGAEKIFTLLQPELKKKDEALSTEIESKFDDVYTLLNNQKKGDAYTLYTDLSESEIKELSQAIDALAEPLSQLGIVTEAS